MTTSSAVVTASPPENGDDTPATTNEAQRVIGMDKIGQIALGAPTTETTGAPQSNVSPPNVSSDVDAAPTKEERQAAALVNGEVSQSGKKTKTSEIGETNTTKADPQRSLNISSAARVAPSSRESLTRRSVGAPPPPPDVESGKLNVTDPDLDLVLDDDDSVDRELRELLGEDGLADIRIDDGDEEVDRLLGVDVEKAKKATVDGVIAPPKVGVDKSHQRCCFGHARRPYKVGNITVVFPGLHERYGFGSIGPHWLGTLSTAALLYAASYFYIHHAFLIGPISGFICVGFTVQCSVTLAMVAFCDPGAITPEKQQRESVARGENGEYAGLPRDGRDLSEWRYCDLCSVYQPPSAAHCPDCNICIDGYDHHCPWMGQCIGKSNMKAFMSFNISWLLYLFYALAWVSFSPAAKKLAMHTTGNAAGADENNNDGDT
mmetsp:Transcript_60392/g.178863  ORF Transcript_60392/g.178863 Transcript_60392/m.178863 type:complete len:433 (-) Transcript_60392:192-1490(-)